MTKETKKQEEKRIVVFSGDRNCKKREPIVKILESLNKEKDKIVVGECRGVDQIVKEEGENRGFEVQVEEAEWKKFGKSAGPKRNSKMLAKFKPKKVYLIHDSIQNSKGTKDMMTKCLRYKVPFELRGTK